FATAADDALRGSRLYRTGIIWPYAVAAPVAATAFQFIFDPVSGLMQAVNDISPGFWDPYLDGGDAFWMIVTVAAWQNISYNFLFFLAGLRAIPTPILEAAAVDGAGPLRRFTAITLPLLSPTFYFLIIMNLADNFTNSFGIVNVMTQGGPGGATNLMVYKIYADGFVGLNLSASSAQSVILMLVMVTVTVLQFRLIERRVNYTV
ncbi:MAG: ABC transporter permease subunit, partial [Hyphomonas sp.]|nr:ABC transporter permease subunit [Hyphomonas sp.]